MTRYDKKIETCSCQVCRSDLAYIVPCMENNDDTGRISVPVEAKRPAVLAVFPIPLVM